MNFLAHAYLSFNHPEIVVGNLISDFVKGKQRLDYPERIQEGIMLHRAIDGFTDKHPLTKQAASLFRPHYGLYAASFMDVVYDHYLALDTEKFTPSLWDFAQNVYGILDSQPILPDKFHRIFPYMKTQNWLYNYQFKEGIHNSLRGLVYRAAYISDSGPAIEIFDKNYDLFRQCYLAFFPEVEDFARKMLYPG